MKCFSVNFKDLADKKKNPKFSLSVREILKNKKIKKKFIKVPKIMKSDIKIKRAIEFTKKWIKEAEAKGIKETFKMGIGIGFTILWCEKRNLKEYEEMLGKDKRKLTGRLKELYQAI